MNVFRLNTITRVLSIVTSVERALWILSVVFICVPWSACFLDLNESHLEIGGIIDSYNEIYVQTRQ